MTLILMVLFSLSVFAQGFEFSFEGTYQTDAAFAANPAVVTYTIHWNETKSDISGIYRDNYFTRGMPVPVQGEAEEDGRDFTLLFPEPIYGVKKISVTSPARSAVAATIPLKITAFDPVGGEVFDETSPALMQILHSATEDPFTDEDACTVGFGVLTGFCGLYSGIIAEVADPGNKCNLVPGNTTLLLGTDMKFKLFLNFIPGLSEQPFHDIGLLPGTPTTNEIVTSGRDCTALEGTTFSPGSCKILSLSGDFYGGPPKPVFYGHYTITDTLSGEACTYRLRFIRRGFYD